MTKLATKISLSNFNPKAYLGQMYPADAAVQGPASIHLGSIIGTATGVKNAFGQDGVTPVFGAKGDFAIDFAKAPDGTTQESIGSGVCYLPEAFMDPLLRMFDDETNADGEITKAGARAVDFAYNVSMVKAGNAAKYSWQLTPLLAAANDPIAAVRAQIVAQQAALAAPAAQLALEQQKSAATPTQTGKQPEAAGAKK